MTNREKEWMAFIVGMMKRVARDYCDRGPWLDRTFEKLELNEKMF